MKERLVLRLPLGSEIMTTVRLATGGIASLARLDLDRSEDLKVCVTESLLLIMHAGYACASVGFTIENGLLVRVESEGEAGEAHAVPEDEISAALLDALAENARIERGERVTISFGFGA